MLLSGLGMAYHNAPQLADWYAGFAAEYLMAESSSLTDSDRDSEAFYFCIRQVAKQMEEEYSVETFPSASEGELRSLGDGRYRVESFVDEAREDGTRVRYAFVCSVAFERGRWNLEELNLTERFAIRE